MDVPVSGGGPSGEDRRFPSEPEARDVNAAKAFLRKAMTAQRIPNRTGPPARQTKAAPDAGTEELPDGGGGNQWHRVGREDQEETVSDEQAWRTHGNDAGDLGKGPGCITATTFQPTEQNPSNLTQFRIRTRASKRPSD